MVLVFSNSFQFIPGINFFEDFNSINHFMKKVMKIFIEC